MNVKTSVIKELVPSKNLYTLLTLSEVGKKIKLSDPKSIKNWLRQNGVTIHKLASRTFVYDLELKVKLSFLVDRYFIQVLEFLLLTYRR